MRLHLGRAGRRLLVTVCVLVGTSLGTHGLASATVGDATRAACASSLPASGARCATDHAAADVLPLVLPGIAGAAGGLLVALVLTAVLARLPVVARRRTADPAPAVIAPSWRVLGASVPGAPAPSTSSDRGAVRRGRRRP